MKLFARTVLAALLVAAMASPALAEKTGDPKKQADIRKLLNLTGAGSLGKQVATQLIDSFRKSFPNAPAAFWDDFAKEIKPEELIDLVVPVYDRNLSHDDIKAIIKFYESPAGKRFAAKLPDITQESMAAGQQWGQKLGAKVMQRLQEQQKK